MSVALSQFGAAANPLHGMSGDTTGSRGEASRGRRFARQRHLAARAPATASLRPQTQVGDIAKTIRPADYHHVKTLGSTIDPRSNQSQHPFREAPAASIPHRSYRPDHNLPNLWTVPTLRN
jgi:hypothetical protein